MTCTSCEWFNRPADVRRDVCIACSTGEYKRHRWDCNELSNKGQRIESLDNHNPEYSDDRDIVMEIRGDYIRSRKGGGRETSESCVERFVRKHGITTAQFAARAYDAVMRFLYELAALTDIQVRLLVSTIREESKSDFGRRVGLTPSGVNRVFNQLLRNSPTIRAWLFLSNGSLAGTRGRKPEGGGRSAIGTDGPAGRTGKATATTKRTGDRDRSLFQAIGRKADAQPPAQGNPAQADFLSML